MQTCSCELARAGPAGPRSFHVFGSRRRDSATDGTGVEFGPSWCSDVACRNTRQLSVPRHRLKSKVSAFTESAESTAACASVDAAIQEAAPAGAPRISTRSSERTELTTVSRMRQTMVHGAWTVLCCESHCCSRWCRLHFVCFQMEHAAHAPVVASVVLPGTVYDPLFLLGHFSALRPHVSHLPRLYRRRDPDR